MFNQQVEVAITDIRHPNTLPSAVEGISHIICCTGTTALPSAKWDFDINPQANRLQWLVEWSQVYFNSDYRRAKALNSPEQVDAQGVSNLVAAVSKDLKRFVFVSSYDDKEENFNGGASMQLPQGPPTPTWFQTIQTITRPFKFFEECAQRYGDTFTARFISSPPIVVLSNPQALQELLTADPNLFDVGTGNRNLQFFLGDNSLLLLDGERHQRQRRLLLPPFHGERMRAYSRLMYSITQQVMTQWSTDKPFSGYAAMQEISLRIILRAMFGLDDGPCFQQLRQLFVSMLKAFDALNGSLLFLPSLQVDLGPWSPWGRFLRQKQQIDQLLYSEIRERRAQPDSLREDILNLMMSVRDDKGQSMTDVELRDELMTLLLAGHDTTTSALAWALYWIHHLPPVQEKLLQELSHLDWEPNQPEWGLQIARLPYLNAVCQETLRIYPIAQFAFARIVKTPFKLMGYQFAPGTVLAPCIHLLHRRADLYPEPRCFKPERFLERQFSAYEYLPFGGGNRRCIGMAFAMFQMKLVLATILSRYQLVLVSKRPARPAGHGVIFKPSGGVQLVVIGQQPMPNTPVRL